MIGRTHGVHAEPTTFGAKVALWCLQADRDRTRLRTGARGDRGVQAVRRGRHVLEHRSCRRAPCRRRRSASRPCPATQVLARDRHAEFLWACAAVGATVELIAVELRHLQRTEVREAQEGFKPGQKGSSAMPHKRNPISAETLSGLSRVSAQQPARRFAGCRAVARTGHLPLFRRADRAARLGASRALRPAPVHAVAEGTSGLPRANAQQSLVEPRSGVQPTGAARARAGGDDTRRRLPRGAGERDARVGRGDRDFRALLEADSGCSVDGVGAGRGLRPAALVAQHRRDVRRARRRGGQGLSRRGRDRRT